MTAISDVLNALSAAGRAPRSVGDNRWLARCPAPGHEDRIPSLSIGVGTDGCVFLHCHSRDCPADQIMAGLDRPPSAMFDEHQEATPSSGHHHDWIADYPYQDELGVTQYGVSRCAGKGRGCDRPFLQWHPDPPERTGRKWGLTRRDGTRIPPLPFHLPALIAAAHDRPCAWVVEGEEDVLALETVGAVATCNSGGAENGNYRSPATSPASTSSSAPTATTQAANTPSTSPATCYPS
jgi:hypothetical protein